ncbi:MAG: type II toxin-antitoxin system HicA family toxin [Cytophagaceae bacterium]|nr:type II toxin-antitoxin system HicA family toxin [Cytophagaceae bacterium]
MPPTSKQVIKLLEKRGFVLKRVKGSHYLYQHPETGRFTLVPFHTKDLPIGTYHGILKQAGIDKNDLK